MDPSRNVMFWFESLSSLPPPIHSWGSLPGPCWLPSGQSPSVASPSTLLLRWAPWTSPNLPPSLQSQVFPAQLPQTHPHLGYWDPGQDLQHHLASGQEKPLMNTRQDIPLGYRSLAAFTSKQEVLACSTSAAPLYKLVSGSKKPKTPVFVIPLNPSRTKKFGVACYRNFWESIDLNGTAGLLFRARVSIQITALLTIGSWATVSFWECKFSSLSITPASARKRDSYQCTLSKVSVTS